MSLIPSNDLTFDPDCHPGRGPHVVVVQWIGTNGDLYRERFDTDREESAKRFYHWRLGGFGETVRAFRLARFSRQHGRFKTLECAGEGSEEIRQRVSREIVEKVGAHLEEEDPAW